MLKRGEEERNKRMRGDFLLILSSSQSSHPLFPLCYTPPMSTTIKTILAIIVVALLIGIMVFVINPAGQLREARDTQRRTDLETIANAIGGYAGDNGGQVPFEITAKETPICRSGVNLDCTGLVNLNALTGAYLRAIPADPTAGTSIDSGYAILWDGRTISLTAPSAEGGQTISVVRVVGKK